MGATTVLLSTVGNYRKPLVKLVFCCLNFRPPWPPNWTRTRQWHECPPLDRIAPMASHQGHANGGAICGDGWAESKKLIWLLQILKLTIDGATKSDSPILKDGSPDFVVTRGGFPLYSKKESYLASKFATQSFPRPCYPQLVYRCLLSFQQPHLGHRGWFPFAWVNC